MKPRPAAWLARSPSALLGRAAWWVLALVALLVLLAVGLRALRARLELEQGAFSSQAALERPVAADAPAVAVPEPTAPRVLPVDPQLAAARTRARELSERNQRAVSALEAGELELAIEGFEACLAAEPGEAVFARNLAEALARRARLEFETGQGERALESYQRALELAPQREDLVRCLADVRTELDIEHGFQPFLTQHFQIHYDASRADLHQGVQFLEDPLEDAYADFRERFGLDPVPARGPLLRVVLYRKSEFSAVTGLGDWAGGAFDGTLRLPVEQLSGALDELVSTLRHELAHAFVRSAGGAGVPGWLNEGLAQYLEQRPREVQRAREALRGQQLVPLEALAGTLSAIAEPAAIHRAYQQSLALVEHLARVYGERLPIELVRAAGAADAQEAEAALLRTYAAPGLEQVLADLAQELSASLPP